MFRALKVLFQRIYEIHLSILMQSISSVQFAIWYFLIVFIIPLYLHYRANGHLKQVIDFYLSFKITNWYIKTDTRCIFVFATKENSSQERIISDRAATRLRSNSL